MKLAVLSDIHGNWPALEAAAADIDAWQPDLVVVNGDVVNDGPRSLECWNYVAGRRNRDGWVVLRGNHEEYVAEWLDPAENARNTAWARATYEAMRPFASAAHYVNYLGSDESGSPAEAAYGANLPRLRMIKRKYDPQNVFRQNQNIEPASV